MTVTEAVSPEREAANEIADVIFRIGRECGRPLVLTGEDRDEIEGIVRKGANADLLAAAKDAEARLVSISALVNFSPSADDISDAYREAYSGDLRRAIAKAESR